MDPFGALTTLRWVDVKDLVQENTSQFEGTTRLLHALSEAAVLVTGQGRILAANQAAEARRAGAVSAGAVSAGSVEPPWLHDVLHIPQAQCARLLDDWAGRQGSAVHILRHSGPGAYRLEGSLLTAAPDAEQRVLLVRWWPEAQPVLNAGDAAPESAPRRTPAPLAATLGPKLGSDAEQLAAQLREAEAASRAKDEFLATLSHEVRAPLNAIIGWSSLLVSGQVTQRHQVQNAVSVIQRSALAQVRLVDDILDMSLLMAGKLKLEVQGCDFADLAEQAIESVRPAAAAKQIQLALKVQGSSTLLMADPVRVRQVLWNLLSNAIKFTGRGGRVQVSVACDGIQYTLQVSDTGQGIEPALLGSLFAPFKPTRSAVVRQVAGLGLGLPLVQQLVSLHGGSVEAFSEGARKGSRFVVHLPVRAAPWPNAMPSTLTASAAERPKAALLQNVRVLVVDDEADTRELFGAVIAQAGGEVLVAESVPAALDIFSQTQPDVLVSDIGMPEETGYDLMRHLRQAGNAVPAIAVTAYTQAEDRARALAAGFDLHVSKPVTPDVLISAVHKLARKLADA